MSSWDPFPSKVFCGFSQKPGMTRSTMWSRIEIRLPWFVRAGVEVTKSPTKVIPAHSHRCLVKGGELWSEATNCVCWPQLWSKQQSHSDKQKHLLPVDFKFSSVLPQVLKGAVVPCSWQPPRVHKKDLSLWKKSFDSRSCLTFQNQYCCPTFGTDFRASVKKASSRKTFLFLSNIAMLETPKVPLILVACWRTFLGELYLEEIRAAPRNSASVSTGVQSNTETMGMIHFSRSILS